MNILTDEDKAYLVNTAFSIEQYWGFSPIALDKLSENLEKDLRFKKAILNFYKNGTPLMQRIFLELMLRENGYKKFGVCVVNFLCLITLLWTCAMFAGAVLNCIGGD